MPLEKGERDFATGKGGEGGKETHEFRQGCSSGGGGGMGGKGFHSHGKGATSGTRKEVTTICPRRYGWDWNPMKGL